MPATLIAVDAGNGGTNAVMKKGKGIKSVYFPSVRAVATGDSLGLGDQFEMQYEWVDWGNHRYVFGDNVLSVSRKGIERHQGADRYGNEFHHFLVTVATALLGVKSGKVNLTLFAPPGMFNVAQKQIMERFGERGKKVAIKFKGDKSPRVWEFETITVLPEGIGAALCFAIDKDGNMIEDSDVLSGRTAIFDMGMYTLDALEFNNGNFNPESLSTATWEGQGIKAHILDPVLRTVKKQGNDFDLITVDDIDAVIRQGLESGDYHLRVAGLEVDIAPVINKYSERYAEWVSNNIIDGQFDALRGYKCAIFIGGGASLTGHFFRHYYNDKVMFFDDYPHTKKIDAVFANAIGGLRFAEYQQKAAK